MLDPDIDNEYLPTEYDYRKFEHTLFVIAIGGAYTNGKFPLIGQQHGNKDEAAIALQCKSSAKLIAALYFIAYSCSIWGDIPQMIIAVWW